MSADNRVYYGQAGDEAAAARGECVWVMGDNGGLLCCNCRCKAHNPAGHEEACTMDRAYEHWKNTRDVLRDYTPPELFKAGYRAALRTAKDDRTR